MALPAPGTQSSAQTTPSHRENLFRSSAILVVDDEPGMRNFLQRALQDDCAVVRLAGSAEEAEELRRREHFDLLIIDIRLPGTSGVDWLRELRNQGDQIDAIFITAYADLETAIEAVRLTVSDFILKPFRLEQILNSVERCLEHRNAIRENILLKRQVEKIYAGSKIIGASEAIKNMNSVANRVASSHVTVLIEGETGSGKELVARHIHELSGVPGHFVPLNCGSISSELIESELFGHAAGAFTGATGAREGLFVYAKNGTLFLDEISEMPLSMQAQFLRVLEEKSVRPVGSDREVAVDTRVVAATNCRLADQVDAGRFRRDLFYRLEVVTVHVPPLRERLQDIPELAGHFLRELAPALGVQPVPLTREQVEQLQNYDWPGNVRELKNVLERYLLLGKFPAQFEGVSSGASGDRPESAGFPPSWSLRKVERFHVRKVLDDSGNNKSKAARRLGISRKTLDRKLREWDDENF